MIPITVQIEQFLKGICTVVTKFADNSKSCGRFLMKVFEGVMSH